MNNDLRAEDKYAQQMKALLMIQVMGQTSVNFLNKKKLGKEMQEYLLVMKQKEQKMQVNGQ